MIRSSENAQTHNLNFDTHHQEIDIRGININQHSFSDKIDFVVGSPPCTQLSFANKGGDVLNCLEKETIIDGCD